MRAWRDFATGAPDEVRADAALAKAPSGELVFSVSICHAGPEDQAAPALNRHALLPPAAGWLRDAAVPPHRSISRKASFCASCHSMPSSEESPAPRARGRDLGGPDADA